MDWLDSLSDYATQGASLYNSISGKAKPTPTAAPAKTNWLLIGGVGAAILLLVVFITRK